MGDDLQFLMTGSLPEYVLKVSPNCLLSFSAFQSQKFPFGEKKSALDMAMGANASLRVESRCQSGANRHAYHA
jgi:hypothetical protein